MILLTGGTGFFGRHLVRQLVSERWPVRVLSRKPDRLESSEAVSWVHGDLTDAASLAPALHNVDTVVHAGAVIGQGPPGSSDLDAVNVGGTRSLAGAARQAGVKRFIHVSSAGVYGDGATASPHRETDPPAPATPYERSKLAAEQALVDVLRGSRVAWTILRPQGLYGADRPATVALFRQVARRRLWLHGPATVIVHPTHVADLVAAVRLTLLGANLDEEVINVGGERWLDYRELVAMIGARIGHEPRQIRAPRAIALAAALAGRAWARASGGRVTTLDRISRQWINRSVDIDKARHMLGFSPVSLSWGLDQVAADLRREGET